MRIATEAASSHDSAVPYQEVIFLSIKKRRPGAPPFLPGRKLLDGVDLRQDLLGADLLGVVPHHRVDQLLHLVAAGERHALELAFLLHLDELRLVLARLDLAAVRAGFLAGPEHRRLQALVELLEGLAREAKRP